MSHPRDPHQYNGSYKRMPQQSEPKRHKTRYSSNKQSHPHSTQSHLQPTQTQHKHHTHQQSNHANHHYQRQQYNKQYPSQQKQHSQQHFPQYTNAKYNSNTHHSQSNHTNSKNYRRQYNPNQQKHQNSKKYTKYVPQPSNHNPTMQAHNTNAYAQQSIQYSQQRYQSQAQQQQYMQQMAHYQHKQQMRPSYKNPSVTQAEPIKKHKTKNKSKNREKPILTESCSLPEDDEVLRASVYLLEDEPQVGDGYSSDNTLFYGKISVSKTKLNNHKTHYLKRLGKEILSNNPKFTGIISNKDQLALKSHNELTKSNPNSKTLYNVITKRLNEEENQLQILSDDSFEKVRRAEKDRKEVIHARQKMRRHKKTHKSRFFFPYGSIGAVLCNLSASTLGCSVLCIPYVFSLCGWLYGFIIIAVIVLLQLLSMRLLLQCQKCTGVRSIQQLTILYLKNKCGIFFINAIIFGYCFTQCIAILIALADLIHPIFEDYVSDSFLANRSFLLVVITLFILLPLSFKDKPPHLKKYSAPMKGKQKRRDRHSNKDRRQENINRFRDSLYNLCMIYFLFAITIACMMRFCDNKTERNISFDSEGIHTGIYLNKNDNFFSKFYALSLGYPIILYCLTTHTEIFKVNEKLCAENRNKLYQIAHGTLIQHTVYILILGSSGYFYFSDNPSVETNIILNLKDNSDNVYILVAMVIIGIAMFLFYPTVLAPSRHSMSVLLFPNQRNNITQHILLTFIIDIFALIVALFIKDLAVLFAWSGAIFATILCLILPGLLFWNIIVFPSKTFVSAMMEHNNHLRTTNSMAQNTNNSILNSQLSKYNLNNKSTLNSVIATATPPLMNYARGVNDKNGVEIDGKSSLLSGGSQSTNQKYFMESNGLPNIMTPDAFNQVIAESYLRLYGSATPKKSVTGIESDSDSHSFLEHKYDVTNSKLSHLSDESFDSHTPEIDITVTEINSSYVSLSDAHRNNLIQSNNAFNDLEEPAMGSYIGSYEGGSFRRENHKKQNKKSKKKRDKKDKKWWKSDLDRYHKLNQRKKDKMDMSREQSKTQTFVSHSKTNNLREASRTIQEKIEAQLKEEKMQRIKTLEKVNQSWTFWFDRVGALLLLLCGFVLFIVGNACNILHVIDINTK